MLDMTYHGHSSRLSLALSSSPPPDLWLVSSEGFSLPCHSSLLSLHSPTIRLLLSSSPLSTSLSLPVPALPLSMLISLLRQGTASHHTSFDPVTVLEAAEVLGIHMEDVLIGDGPVHQLQLEDSNQETKAGQKGIDQKVGS